MASVIFWTVKIIAWAGIVFSAYSIVKPGLMLRAFTKTFQWKMKWFGFTGNIEPAKSAPNLTRFWSVVILIIFLGINYVFGNVVTLSYVIK